jgi:hypothetical protein
MHEERTGSVYDKWNISVVINILPLVEGVTVITTRRKTITRDEVEGDIFSECGNLT